MEEQEITTAIVHRSDRELVQSYIFTFTKQDFDVYEKRIIYNIVYDKQVQDYVREQINAAKNNGTSSMELKTRQYIMPLNKIAAHKGDYERVKNALLRLQSKRFEYIDKTRNRWLSISFISNPEMDLFYSGNVEFELRKEVLKIISDIKYGYRQFDFQTALRLKSAYSMRFYEMFSRQDGEENEDFNKFKISDLKELFGLSEKYKNNTMFVKRVVDPSKKELDEIANFSFDYELVKSLGSRKYDEIKFHVYRITENERKNNELLENRVKAELSKYIKISETLYQYLQEIGLSETSINSNLYTFYICEQMFWNKMGKLRGTATLITKIDELKERALRMDRDNWIRYIIGTLKKIQKIENEKEMAEKIAIYNEHREQEKINEPENKTES